MERCNNFYKAVPEHATDIVSARRDEHGILRRQRAHGFSDRIMRDHEPLIKYYIDLFIQRLYEHGVIRGRFVNIAAWYKYTTFDIIGDLAFGKPFGCLNNSKYHS